MTIPRKELILELEDTVYWWFDNLDEHERWKIIYNAYIKYKEEEEKVWQRA